MRINTLFLPLLAANVFLRDYNYPALLHAAVFHLDAEEAVTIER